MLFNRTIFLGIDPTLARPGGQAGRPQRAFVYAALDQDLELTALGVGSQEDVLAFVAGQEAGMVAINAPRRPNQGLMAQQAIRDALLPPPKPGRWNDFRLAEYQLRQHNIGVTRTPEQETDCDPWMRSAFGLYTRLERLGFVDYPAGEAPRQLLEVHPHAGYCCLLEQAPFPKGTLEGRLQRQLVLTRAGLRLADPMDFFEEITPHRLLRGNLPLTKIHTPLELDALMAAYIAWKAGTCPEEVALVGDPQEGQIALPVPELRPHY